MGKRGPRTDLKCPECGGRLVFREKAKFGPFYGCERWPDCRGAHSAHADGTPMGIPADQATRTRRHEAHLSFDSLRLELGWSKSQGYRWLAERMEMTPKQCHIGRFDIDQCNQVIDVCEKARPKSEGQW